METLKLSKSTIITKEAGKYFVSVFNQYTGAVETKELLFNDFGIAECKTGTQSVMTFRKSEIDIGLAVSSMF